MEERIKAQVKGSDRAEITELILDTVRESSFVGLDESFTGLTFLSANNVGLTSLEGLPSLPSVVKLELSDNKLTGGLETLGKCPSLRHLSLAGNRLASINDLTPLKSLESLEMLDLLNCPLTKLEGYRDKVFSMLPGLRSLDGLDQDGQEVEESDSEVEEDGEEEAESDGDEDDEVGLDYLNRDIDSDESSDGGEYDPADEGEEGEEEEGDHLILSDGEEEGGEKEEIPAAKRQKVAAEETESNTVAED